MFLPQHLTVSTPERGVDLKGEEKLSMGKIPTEGSATPRKKKTVKRSKSSADGINGSSKSKKSTLSSSTNRLPSGGSRSLRSSRTVDAALDDAASASALETRSMRGTRRSSVAVSSLTAELKKKKNNTSPLRRSQSSPVGSPMGSPVRSTQAEEDDDASVVSSVSTASKSTSKKSKSKKNASCSLESKLSNTAQSTSASPKATTSTTGLDDSSTHSTRSRRSRRDGVVIAEIPPSARKLSRSTTLPENRKLSPLRRSKSNVEDGKASGTTSTATSSANRSPMGGAVPRKARSRRSSSVAVLSDPQSQQLAKEEKELLRASTGTSLPKKSKSVSPNKAKKTLSRTKTFDATGQRPAFPSNPPRGAAFPSNPPRGGRRTSLPGADARKDMLKKSSGKKATRKLKTVRFHDAPAEIGIHELKEEDITKFWYSQEDLKMLMDHELTLIMRSSGTARGLHFCKRGIEHLLEGKDKAAKIYKYVRNVMKMEREIKARKASDDATTSSSSSSSAAKELRTYSQTLTKEDRKRAYRLGFQDASEVQVMKEQNQSAEAQATREETSGIKKVRPEKLPVGESVRLLVDTHAPHLGESIRDLADSKLGESVRNIAHAPGRLGTTLSHAPGLLGESVRNIAHAPVHTVKKIKQNMSNKGLGGRSNHSKSSNNFDASDRSLELSGRIF